jgi:hypothetical protein
VWLAASDPSQNLLQYGAVGAIAVILIAAVGVLAKVLLGVYYRERDRADELEQEVNRLNKAIQDRYIDALSDATKAVSAALREVRRR